MKLYLQQIKANDKFHGKKKFDFVKTCDELVIGMWKTKQFGFHHDFYR